jgi:hypothetical protein
VAYLLEDRQHFCCTELLPGIRKSMEKPFNVNLSETILSTVCSENTGTLQKYRIKPALFSIYFNLKNDRSLKFPNFIYFEINSTT